MITNYTNIQSTNTKSKCQMMPNNAKLHVVYRLDFAIKLKEKGHIEVFSKRNPQKPWLYCWYFAETESFLADLQELMEGSKNG